MFLNQYSDFLFLVETNEVQFLLDNPPSPKRYWQNDACKMLVKPKTKSQAPVSKGPKGGPHVQTKSEKSKNLILWTGADTIIILATTIYPAEPSTPPFKLNIPLAGLGRANATSGWTNATSGFLLQQTSANGKKEWSPWPTHPKDWPGGQPEWGHGVVLHDLGELSQQPTKT